MKKLIAELENVQRKNTKRMIFPVLLTISDFEINEFKENWGQTHSELCANLGYSSDDIIMLDFFWIEADKKWYNKEASSFTEREQVIANYLRLG